MGLKLNVPEVKGQLSQMDSVLRKDKTKAQALKQAVKSFTGQGSLKGQAYQNARSYFNQVHVPILAQAISICDALLAANKRYRTALSKAEEPILDEAKLEEQIRKAENQLEKYKQLQKKELEQSQNPLSSYGTPPHSGAIISLLELIQKLKKQLKSLHEVNAMTSGLYTAEEAAVKALNRNIRTVQSGGGWNAATGKFVIPKDFDLSKSQAAIDNAANKGKKWDTAYDGDPVNMVTGNYIYEKELLTQGGRTPLSFTLFYNSADDGEACLGACGFTHTHRITIQENQGELTLTLGDGRQELYALIGDTGRSQAGYVDRSLVKTAEGWRYESEEQQVYHFDHQGSLLFQEDKQGSGLRYNYDGRGLLRIVESTAGTGLSFTYDPEDRITEVSDRTGRTIRFTYESGLLTKVTTEEGGAFTYTYDGDRKIASITNPRGVTTLTNTFDGNFRVQEQTFPDGGKMTYCYRELERETILTEQNGNQIRHMHDERGRSTKTIYYDGEETIAYNEQNQQTEFTDKNGNVSRFEYDAQGNLITAVNALGEKMQLYYDEAKNPVEVRFGGIQLQQNMYDRHGNVVKTTDGIGRTTQVTYNSYGQPVCIERPDGSHLRMAYDSRGNLIKMTDALDNEVNYGYDDINRVIASTDGNGNKTTYTYDRRSNLTSVTNPEGKTRTYQYNESDKLTSVTEFDGSRIAVEYNELNKPSRIIDQNGGVTTITYDKMWNIQRVTDPEGNAAKYFYDPLSRLTTQIDPEGRETTFQYDPCGNRTQIMDPLGHTMTFTYDALGRLICEKDANGAETKTEYDLFGNVRKITDALGNATVSEYDQAGQKIKETDLLGKVTSYTYTPLGQIETITDHKGRVTAYTYLPGGLLQQVSRPDGTWERYGYDPNQNITSIENQDGAIVTFVYDALDRLIESRDQDGNHCLLTYDALGRTTSFTDPNGNTTRYQYSPMGELQSVTDALGNETSYAYDKTGQLCVIRQISRLNESQKGLHVTRYERDRAGRVTNVIDALGNQETYAYNKRGELKLKTDRDNHRTAFDYDPAGNLAAIHYGDGKSVKYQYNALRQLMEVQDWLGTTTIERDAYGRETAITDHRGSRVGYEWNEENQPIQTLYPDGSRAVYAYDEYSRLRTLTAGGQTAHYCYDASGRLAEKALPGGIATQYAYNCQGQLMRLTHQDQEGVLDQYDYRYDPAGNKIAVRKFRRGLEAESGRYAYAYDAVNRLIGVSKDGAPVSAYSYDAFGNRTARIKGAVETRYQYNPLNQLVQMESGDATLDYQYDHRGNLTKILQQGKVKHAYQYDALNRLTQAVNQTGQKAEYLYNGLGLRVGKRDLQNPAKTVNYVLDMTRPYNNLLQKQENGAAQTFYWDQDVTFLQDGISTQVYLQDELGSPVRLLEPNGVSAEVYGYDEFGQDLYGNQGNGQPFGYIGYVRDSVADTYFAQAREYLPQAGRFMAEDLVMGSMAEPQTLNPYTYCWNQPLQFVDLDGMKPSNPSPAVPKPIQVSFDPKSLTTPSFVLGTAGSGLEILEVGIIEGSYKGFEKQLSASYIAAKGVKIPSKASFAAGTVPIKVAGKAVPIVGTALDIGGGVYEDVTSGSSAKKTLTNAGVSLAFDAGELGASILAGAAFGSSAPIAGTIIGALAGAGTYVLLEGITFNGKTIKEWVKGWIYSVNCID